VLALGAAGALVSRPAAMAGQVTVGGLSFAVPDDFRPGLGGAVVGLGWQWTAGRPGTAPGRPAAVVLARADLASAEPGELLGLVFAGSVAGFVPDLRIGRARTREMPGGGDQRRVEVRYAVSRGVLYHGSIMVATRRRGPAGLLAVLGDDALTAGTIDGVLESARWVS
jgi:hypothetical protein